MKPGGEGARGGARGSGAHAGARGEGVAARGQALDSKAHDGARSGGAHDKMGPGWADKEIVGAIIFEYRDAPRYFKMLLRSALV